MGGSIFFGGVKKIGGCLNFFWGGGQIIIIIFI